MNLKKILILLITILLLISCRTFNDIPSGGNNVINGPNGQIQYQWQVQNSLAQVSGTAQGYSVVNIKLMRSGLPLQEKTAPVSKSGYFTESVGPVQSGDQICIQDSGCSNL